MRRACLALALCWTLAAAAAGEPLYRVPWPDGLSFRFSQAPGGRITSHVAKADLQAVDIAMPEGTPVLAARAGVVEAVEDGHGATPTEEPATYYGNFVRVRHADGTAATYAHLRHRGVVVQPGAPVREGELLAVSGFTGDITEPHLHFGVTRTAVNAAGWREELPVPVTFYVGRPPLAFEPRPAISVTANYDSPAAPPRPGSERRLVEWKPRPLAPEEEPGAWMRLALWLAAGAGAATWFWRFSRR